MQIVQFVTSNWQEIVTALAGVVLSARIIVKLTPTPADDTLLEKVIGFLKHLGLHVDAKK